MKIKYILLENFSGIYAGTGRTKLEIDFSKNKNKIIILNAANGKGKTTLLSLMHPLRGTYDERKNITLPNELGHKICIIEDNGNEYKCEHFYGKKNKSFISKNKHELNENGNIRTFNEIIEKELGINEEYFKIGKIGSNVSNFIDLKTAERKKYINQFIPSIDDFLQAYDVVKNKYMVLNTQIKMIKNNIEKYSKLRELKDIEKSLDDLYEQREIMNNSLITNKSKYDSFQNNINQYFDNFENIFYKIYNEDEKFEDNIEQLLIKLDNDDFYYENEFRNIETELNNFINNFKIRSFDTIEETFEYIKTLEIKFIKNKTEMEERIKNIDLRINSLKSERTECLNKIEYFDEKIQDDDIFELTEEEIENFNNKLELAEKEISTDSKFIKLMIENDKGKFEETDKFYENNPWINNFSEYINKFDELKSNYNFAEITAYYENKWENPSNVSKKIRQLEKSISEKERLLSNIITKVNQANNILPKRSIKCNDDNCEFVKNALEIIKNDEPNISKIEGEINELKEKLEKLEEYLNICEKCNEINNELNNLNSQIREKFAPLFSNVVFNRQMLLTNNTNLDELKYFERYSNYRKAKKNISDNENIINDIKSKLEKFKLSDKIIKEYNEQLENYNNRLTKIEEEINTLNNEKNNQNYSLINKKINICKKYYEVHTKYKDTKNEYDNFHSLYLEFFKEYNNYKSFLENNKINDIENNIGSIEKALKEINIKIDDTKSSIQIIKDNMEQLKEIEKIFDDVVEVKNALDPKKGIPIIFANEYLKNISTKANKLLEIAFNNHFKIRFNVTASDFLVEVYKSDGTFLEDIKLASQGEISLTNVSLSLSMVECMIKKYNILYLDEVDSTLSTENRKLFIDLIDKQIDNLNIEQLFIITHNNEFYNKDVDLILLEGHDCDLEDEEFMKGKNIIFKI